jgi:hypothetical protein
MGGAGGDHQEHDAGSGDCRQHGRDVEGGGQDQPGRRRPTIS